MSRRKYGSTGVLVWAPLDSTIQSQALKGELGNLEEDTPNSHGAQAPLAWVLGQHWTLK